MSPEFIIKASMTRGNPFFQQSKLIGKMFQNNQNTNGNRIIGENKKAPMSMNDIAAQKKEQELTRAQEKHTTESGELAKKQQQFEQQQMHERHKLEIEKMLAKAKGPDQKITVQPRPEEPPTHKAINDWAGRLAKDLKRLVTR